MKEASKRLFFQGFLSKKVFADMHFLSGNRICSSPVRVPVGVNSGLANRSKRTHAAGLSWRRFTRITERQVVTTAIGIMSPISSHTRI